MKVLLCSVGVLLASASIAGPVVLGQSREPRVRTLFWDPGAPIPGRLLPDDEIVTVKMGGILDYITPGYALSADEVIADAAVRSDLVAVIDVARFEGVLSLDDTWVNTRLTGTVREVIRERKAGEYQRGQQLQADLGGGEVVVRKVTVRVGDSRRWPLNQSYLLFLGHEGRQDGSFIRFMPQ